MEIFQSLDFFGSYLHFYVNKQKKVYTLLGGILTIISFVVCLIVLINLFRGVISRNPQITMDDQPSKEYPKIKFGEEKIYIPWRIADYSVHSVNFTGLIYPIIYYYYGVKDKKTGAMPYNYKILKYKNCNETDIEIYHKFNNSIVDINSLYCIDMEDLYMGGDYFHDFVYHIQMDLFLCEDGVNYNTPGKKCTDFNELLNIIGEDNGWHFEFYYPEILIKSQDKKNPIEIFYNSHFYNFNKLNTKVERLYLKQFILTDDQGWIFENKNTTSIWGFDRIDSDSYVRSDGNDIMADFTSSKIYSLVIYVNSNKKIYTRNYPKLLESLGNIITLVHSIFIIFKYISQFFTEAYQDRDILNNIFVQKYVMNKKYIRYNKIKKNLTNKFNLINQINPLDKARLTCASNTKKGSLQNQINTNVNQFSTIDKDLENFSPTNQRKSQYSNNNENFPKFNNEDEPKEVSIKIETKEIKYNNYDDSSCNKNIENSSFNFYNKIQKYPVMNKINNNGKRNSLFMNSSLFNQLNNKKIDKKCFDLMKVYMKKNDSMNGSKELDNFRLNDFKFPYYLYLLNIFDKTFSTKICCINRKFRNVWKYMINMFDVVKFINLQANVELINKIIFEIENENDKYKKFKNS